MKDSSFAPLSPQDEIALRRAALGSKIADERVVERLCSMSLLQRVSGDLRLTPLGRQRYEAMAKAPLLARPRSIHAVTNYVEGLIQKAQALNASLIGVGNGSRMNGSIPIGNHVPPPVVEAIPAKKKEVAAAVPPSATPGRYADEQSGDSAARLGRTRLSMIEHRLNQIRLRNDSRQRLAESRRVLNESRRCIPPWMGHHALTDRTFGQEAAAAAVMTTTIVAVEPL